MCPICHWSLLEVIALRFTHANNEMRNCKTTKSTTEQEISTLFNTVLLLFTSWYERLVGTYR